MSSSHISDIDNTQFYRVLFSHIANLIKKRHVFVMQGEAFVPEQEMAFMFVSHFKRILISSFEVSMNIIKAMISVISRTVTIFLFCRCVLDCT